MKTNFPSFTLIAAVAALHLLVAAATAAPGDLDPTFGIGGAVTTDIGTSTADGGVAVAIQSDGKVVVAGRTNSGTDLDFVVARYLPNGELDTSFGTGGKVVTDIAGRNDFVMGLVLQTDGKIVVAGYSETSGLQDITLVRYNPDGSLDPTFGGDGKVSTNFGRDDRAYSVAIQSDQKIVICGGYAIGGSSDFAVARYNTDGSLDATFSGDGKTTVNFGSYDFGFAVEIQSDGKIVIGGFSGAGPPANFAVGRLNPDGSLDTTFSGNGRVTTHVGPEDTVFDLAIQPDGKILAAGETGAPPRDFALLRYNADGTLDTTFDGDGIVLTDFFGGSAEYGRSVSLQGDGKMIMAGTSRIGSGFSEGALARYLPDGSLDPAFGIGGLVTTDFTAGNDGFNDSILLPDGRLLAAGSGDYDFLLARYEVEELLVDPEEELRGLSEFISELDVGAFTGKNANVQSGRRKAFSNKANAAANAVRDGDIADAIDLLESMLKKVDGAPKPPDWMNDPERLVVFVTIEDILSLLVL